MNTNLDFLSLLKSKAIRFEDHSWTNSRGTNYQSALIFKPEIKEEIFYYIENKIIDIIDIDINKNFNFFIEEKHIKTHFYFSGLEIFQNVSLSKKKNYKSYIADLDAPVRERINYLKAELRKARAGKIFGRPPLLIEELLKQAEQKTLRQQIEEKLNKYPKKELDHFKSILSTAKKCLISNYLNSPQYLWGNLFFSFERDARCNSKISKLIESAIKSDLAFDDYFLLHE
jgi:hypothetical protein